jgi:hypothetical protein
MVFPISKYKISRGGKEGNNLAGLVNRLPWSIKSKNIALFVILNEATYYFYY